MAVATYKISFMFEGIQSAPRYSSSLVGWSETWYRELDGSLDAVLVNAANSQYVSLRRAFMPSIYRCVWVRATDVNNPRSSKTRAYLDGYGSYSGPPPEAGFIAPVLGGPPRRRVTAPTQTPDVPPAQVTCAVLVDLVRLPTAAPPVIEAAHHRQFLIRGLPMDMINGNVLNTGVASFGIMKEFLNFIANHEVGEPVGLAASPFLIRFNTPTNPKDYEISALAPLPADPRQIVVSAPGLPVIRRGDRVQLTKVNLPANVNRIWTASADSVVGGPVTLGRAKKAIPVQWDTTGRVRVKSFTNGPAGQYLIVGLRTKDTGRPFRLTRGRRRAGG